MWWNTIIVEPSIPIRIRHQDCPKAISNVSHLNIHDYSPLLCANLIPTPFSPLLPVALILATRPTRSGSRYANARDCMPPIDEPIDAYKR